VASGLFEIIVAFEAFADSQAANQKIKITNTNSAK